MPKHEKNDVELVRTWVLPPAATLGSSIRAKGILLELRARLPLASKKLLDIEQGELTLTMTESAKAEFHAAVSVVARALEDIESLPVIPRGSRISFRSGRASVIAGSRTAACRVLARAR